MSVWIQLIVASAFLSCGFLFFFFLVQPALVDFSTMNNVFVHCSRTHKFHFSATFSLKMGPTALFKHLKIILLQYFQFQFSVSAKISSIQTDPIIIFNHEALLSIKFPAHLILTKPFHRSTINGMHETSQCL